jgi:hypothetical protein
MWGYRARAMGYHNHEWAEADDDQPRRARRCHCGRFIADHMQLLPEFDGGPRSWLFGCKCGRKYDGGQFMQLPPAPSGVACPHCHRYTAATAWGHKRALGLGYGAFDYVYDDEGQAVRLVPLGPAQVFRYSQCPSCGHLEWSYKDGEPCEVIAWEVVGGGQTTE